MSDNLKVGIHEMERGLLSEWSKKYVAILEFNSIDWELLSIDDLDFWERLRTCSHFIYHWGGSSDAHQKAHTILPVIEFELGIPIFPDWQLSWHYDDKIKGYYLLNSLNFPTIDTNVFFNKQKAITWIENTASFPQVFKLSRGAGSNDVMMVKNKYHAKRITKKIFGKGIVSGKVPGNNLWIKDFRLKKYIEKKSRSLYRKIRGLDANRNYFVHKNYVLFQKYLPKNTHDTRVTTIGTRAFAFRRHNRTNDFRASGSGLIDHNPEMINKECVEIALEISKKMKFSCMTYDFLFDENSNPRIAEISYTFNDYAVYQCHGYWDNSLNWVEGNFWPELLQLVDFLKKPDLTCPLFSEK